MVKDLPSSLAFVDIETTGNSPVYDKIIEIGILRVEENKVIDQFSTLLNPGMHVSPFIESLTGISKQDLERAPFFEDKKEEILQMLAGCIFVAHNVRFDYGFLRNEFRRHSISFTSKHLCTVKLSRFLYPQHTRHNLDSLMERFDISCQARHRAFDDAKVVWEFYKKLQTEFPDRRISEAISYVLKKPTIPLHLSEKKLNDLPESPGVYIFYGDVSTPLYIGKSKNIRERVLSHFSSDYTSSKEMQLTQEVKHIETIKTCGDLGAQLLESQLIKKMQPLHNRKLREKRLLTYLKKTTDKNGYDTVVLEHKKSITVDEIENVLGVFRSKKQAKDLLNNLVKERGLCQKILGLQSTNGSCFAHQLGWCKGACVGKEKALFYNIRFLQAFYDYKIKKWPFAGPIFFEEKDDEGNKEIFLIDKWCIIQRTIISEYTQEVKTYDYSFDYDAYKILSSTLLKNKKTEGVQVRFSDLPSS